MQLPAGTCSSSSFVAVSLSFFSLPPSLQEAQVLEPVNSDIEIPCVVQWGMLWFSAPTSLNNDLLNDGVILEKQTETINWAFHNASFLPCWWMNPPRSCFLRSIRAVLEGMTEWVWNPQREMKGWELGGRPDLVPENEDDKLDAGTEPEDL